MKVNSFVSVGSWQEAYKLLKASPKNKILGGGLWLKKGNAQVDTLIDLSKLGLNKIEDKGNYVEVGSMVSQRDFEVSPIIKSLGGGVISEAVSQIMGPAFRNIATVGGSIYGKFGFSDLITVLLGFDVELQFYPNKKMSLEEYLAMPGFYDGILTHIRIQKSDVKAFFKKVCITALDYPILNVCISKGKEYKVVVGSRPLVATRLSKVEQYLNNGGLDFEEASKIAEEEIKVADSMATKGEYRKELTKVYVRRGLEEVNK